MNMNLTVKEVLGVLFSRLRRSRLLNIAMPDLPNWLFVNDDKFLVEASIRELIGHSWHHDCFCDDEYTLRIPIVAVWPTSPAPLFEDSREFILKRPENEIKPSVYLLVDVFVTHEHHMKTINSNYRSLNIIEASQLLAQSCPDGLIFSGPRCLGLGSVTTKHIGLQVKGSTDLPVMHVHFRGYDGKDGVCARIARSKLHNPINEEKHHLAVCRHIIDPITSRTQVLGILERLHTDD